jgi:dipeptidyl aminopeptidase/acylaminoacyl peptidase
MLYALGPWETPLSRLHQSLCDITAFDVLWDSKDDRFIISNTVSNASEPDEVSAVEVHGEQRSFRGQLSCHNTAISALGLSVSRQIFACAPDGQQSDGILFTPQTPGPYPTVVMVHGGPYYRVTQSFAVCHYLEVPLLTAAGYAVLCPNYRGSSGRGEEFAASAHGGMGTTDHMDVIADLKEAIKENLVDETRVAISGWSQGGFLSYLAVTREDFQYKAAVCGAGVVDWEMLTLTSDAYAFEADLAGGAPWEADYTPRHDGSPIWNIKNVETPILILHGEEDERVPLSQAIAFGRGCQHRKVPVEMVIYPREKHRVLERKHVIDMWERIRRFYDLYLK